MYSRRCTTIRAAAGLVVAALTENTISVLSHAPGTALTAAVTFPAAHLHGKRLNLCYRRPQLVLTNHKSQIATELQQKGEPIYACKNAPIASSKHATIPGHVNNAHRENRAVTTLHCTAHRPEPVSVNQRLGALHATDIRLASTLSTSGRKAAA